MRCRYRSLQSDGSLRCCGFIRPQSSSRRIDQKLLAPTHLGRAAQLLASYAQFVLALGLAHINSLRWHRPRGRSVSALDRPLGEVTAAERSFTMAGAEGACRDWEDSTLSCPASSRTRRPIADLHAGTGSQDQASTSRIRRSRSPVSTAVPSYAASGSAGVPKRGTRARTDGASRFKAGIPRMDVRTRIPTSQIGLAPR
jgi:hypothetical protein